MREWPYHHQLQGEQLAYADSVTTVRAVSFYHGGDVLYELDAVPGTWHEVCLFSAEDLGTLEGAGEFFRRRASGAHGDAFARALDAVTSRPADAGDELLP